MKIIFFCLTSFRLSFLEGPSQPILLVPSFSLPLLLVIFLRLHPLLSFKVPVHHPGRILLPDISQKIYIVLLSTLPTLIYNLLTLSLGTDYRQERYFTFHASDRLFSSFLNVTSPRLSSYLVFLFRVRVPIGSTHLVIECLLRLLLKRTCSYSSPVSPGRPENGLVSCVS